MEIKLFSFFIFNQCVHEALYKPLWLCVCVCVRLFLPWNRGHEPTHQNQIEDNTATVDCVDSPRLEKWCKRMQMHVDTRVCCRGKSTVSECNFTHQGPRFGVCVCACVCACIYVVASTCMCNCILCSLIMLSWPSVCNQTWRRIWHKSDVCGFFFLGGGCMCQSLSICLSIYLSIFYIYLFIYLSIFYICLSIYLS